MRCDSSDSKDSDDRASKRERGRHRRGHGRRGRKQRVLHTRVSDGLAEDIRRIADDLRVPASNLVRNVLEEVFDVVESMSDDVGDLFEEVLDEAESVRARLRSAGVRRRARRDGVWEAARAEVDETEGPPPPPRAEAWHLVEAGVATGPFARADLVEAVRTGRLTPDTLVWTAGMREWSRAAERAELGELFSPPPVP